jgi:hypothetical protein
MGGLGFSLDNWTMLSLGNIYFIRLLGFKGPSHLMPIQTYPNPPI